MPRRFLTAISLAVALAGCGDRATKSVEEGSGPNPTLPPPHETLFSTVNIAPAKGWPDGAAPAVARGLRVAQFAGGLEHPRNVLVLPQRRRAGRRDQRPAPAGRTAAEFAAGSPSW